MRTVKGLAALLALTALVVGIPAALILLAGNPIPDAAQLQQALTGVDFGGQFLMGTVLPVIAWVFWASFIYSLIVELIALARRVDAPELGGIMRPQQALAGALIAAVLALGAGAPATALTPEGTSNAPAATATVDHDTHSQEGPEAYTVQRGDTLWSIAEDRLGHGSRWSELAQTLKSTPQADGQTLTDPDLIYEGWKVDLPEDAQPSPHPASEPAQADAPAEQQPADETSAQEPAQAPVEATTDDQAPAPIVTLPGEAAEEPAQPSAPEVAPAPVPGAAFTEPAEQLTSAQEPAEAPAEEAGPTETTEWATLGGIGAFAAAGLLGIIGLRRQLQRRRRRPGQTVPMPEQETARLESQLRVVAEPEQAEELDIVQRWLARWAHQTGTDLPELFLVRVSPEQIALYLMAPAQLPEPFHPETEDGVVWTLASGSIELEEDLPSAPWPSLVTIGQDDTCSQVLLDLERLGTLGIDGAPELTSQVLDAMAVELTTSAWSENTTITLAGVAPGLAQVVNDGRVRQVDDLDLLIDQLEGKAADVREALHTQGAASLDQARPANLDEAFGPEIVLLGIEPTTEQAHRLNELAGAIPRLGIAAVTTSNPLASDWILHLEDEHNADLHPVNQHLRPQKITPEEAERIKQLLATALQDPTATERTTTAIDINTVLEDRPHLSAVPTLDDTDLHDMSPTEAAAELEAEHLDDTTPAPTPAVEAQTESLSTTEEEPQEPEAPVAETVQDDVQDEPARAETEDLQDAAQAPAESPTATPVAEAEPTEPEDAEAPTTEDAESAEAPAAEKISSDDPEKQIDLHAAELLEQTTTAAPMVLMLGELKLVGERGTAPVTATTGEVSATQRARCVAMAAFLALNPGASAEAVHAAFWPNQRAEGKTAASSRNRLTSQTRRLLGQADDGAPYLPSVGGEGYRLHEDVLTDWQVLQSLIGDDPVQASTPALVAAMRLVRGEPLAHAKPANVAWADNLVQEMVQTICDAAHELVARSLASGHREHAQLAARVGRTVDPANEAAWRDAMLAEAAAGNREEVNRLITQLYAYLEDFEEDFEPEDETIALIEQLKAHGYRVAS